MTNNRMKTMGSAVLLMAALGVAGCGEAEDEGAAGATGIASAGRGTPRPASVPDDYVVTPQGLAPPVVRDRGGG